MALALSLATVTSAFAQAKQDVVNSAAPAALSAVVEKKGSPAVEILEVREKQLSDRKIIIQRIKNPVLANVSKAPLVSSPSVEKPQNDRGSTKGKSFAEKLDQRLFFVSATIYDNNLSLVRWQATGIPVRPFAAWSNINFKHFSGIGSFEADGINHMMLLGLATQDSSTLRASKEQKVRSAEALSPPAMPAGVPFFTLIEGDPNDVQGIAPMQRLHEIYKTEAAHLAITYDHLERARVEREAFLKATTPVLKDIVIRYWKVEPKRQNGVKKGENQ